MFAIRKFCENCPQLHAVFRYESFSYQSDELEFSWREGESTVNRNISLAQFDVQTSLVARLS